MAVVILDSIIEGCEYFDPVDRAAFIMAVTDYMSGRGLPEDLKPHLKGTFVMMRDSIDNAMRRRDAARENGRKGGRPRKWQAAAPGADPAPGGGAVAGTHQEPTGNPTETQTEPNGKPRENPTETQPKAKQEQEQEQREEELPDGSSKKSAAKRRRFAPPTAEEVAGYDARWSAERGRAPCPPREHERFCAYYASKGWRVGRDPMKDWRAAWRGWVLRNDGRGGNGGTVSTGVFEAYG